VGWRRLGQIYVPRGEREFLISHASVPFAEPLDGGLHRIWFSPRDAQNRSHIAWLVLDLHHPERILEMSPAAALGTGPVGAFDDCGAMMSWLTLHEGRRRIYYIGWNTRGTVPFHVSIGVADAAPDGAWLRRPGPVLERSVDDPWFCSNPCVLPEAGGWRMWYLSGLGWEDIDGRPSPSYHICDARSVDGVHWHERGRIAAGTPKWWPIRTCSTTTASAGCSIAATASAARASVSRSGNVSAQEYAWNAAIQFA
jgi:hypothetical protein